MSVQGMAIEHTYFSKLFRKVTGTTFVDWNRVRRIEQAKTLLSESDLNVVSIGLAVGYADVTTFCRASGRPREWRLVNIERRANGASRAPRRPANALASPRTERRPEAKKRRDRS